MHCGRKSFHIGVRARGAGRAAAPPPPKKKLETAIFRGIYFQISGSLDAETLAMEEFGKQMTAPPPVDRDPVCQCHFTKHIERLLKDKHKRGGYFLCVVKVLYPGIFSLAFFSVVFAQCPIVRNECCKMYMLLDLR